MAIGEEVSNKQIIFKDFVTSFPKETDMEMASSTIKLKVSEGSKAILVRNLYFSCDPYMRLQMSKPGPQSYFPCFIPGSKMGSDYAQS
ncbi:hypothetical protein AMTR_s00020p00043420 [Amborella trichopoda]|uniref:Oxidoreductase N-terminal domain-containing protein n=1 Tax=Amborella trichopoda TaxID=13333 RepID=W1PVT7_AMBTC|nr:hypothetical protein AMTR_s00020p00043420 [Amborella trichopoda]